MSITAALSNAVSGLTAASRTAEVVSGNVANALTDGYARREIDLTARITGGQGAGVQVAGVTRIVDETLLRDRRLSGAELGGARTLKDFYDAVLKLAGQPDDPASLSGLAAGFESSLVEAASRPDSDARLAAVLAAEQQLAGAFESASDQIQQLRVDADTSIAGAVRQLNGTLSEIADLNALITRTDAVGSDTAGLLDRRQTLIDQVSDLVPVRIMPRDNGAVALYSMTGATLLDGKPAVLEFSRTEPITADMTQGSGALSGLNVNGQPVATAGENGPLSGGRLAALFAVRDEHAVTAQTDLDGLATDLIQRFQDPALDPTLAAGDPGLFTDGGGPYDPLETVGLAGRLSVNALADPARGGALWRLRDGLGAAAPGPVGEGALLQGYADALAEARVPAAGNYGAARRTFHGLASDLTSRFGQALFDADNRVAFTEARYTGLRDAEQAKGVDTDQEMQKLLLVEQAYAANARVIKTVDDLIQTLIGI